MKAYAYVRVSTAKQFDRGNSLLAQTDKIIAFADSASLDLGREVIRDFGSEHGQLVTRERIVYEQASARRKPFLTRPLASALSASLGSGDVLIFAKIDRMFRGGADCLNTFEMFGRRRIRVVILDLIGLQVDMDSAARTFVMGIFGLLAGFESDNRGERVRDARRARAERGFFNGGTVPLLFRVHKDGSGSGGGRLVPCPAERKHARLFHKLRYEKRLGIPRILEHIRVNSIRPPREGMRYNRLNVSALIQAEEKIRTLAQDMGVPDTDDQAVYAWHASQTGQRWSQRCTLGAKRNGRPDAVPQAGD